MVKQHQSKAVSILNIVISIFILTFILPVGDVGRISLQNFFLLLFLSLSIIVLFDSHLIFDAVKNYTFELMLFVIGLIWCLVSVCQGHSFALRFYILLYITAAVFLMFCLLRKYNFLNMEYIIKSLFWMMFIKMTGKFLIEFLFVTKMIEYEEILHLYTGVFNTNVTTMTMSIGNLTLARIQSSSDLIVISLMPFFWVLPKLNKKIRFVLFVITGAYTVIVFSRIAIAQFCCYALVYLIYNWRAISKRWKWISSIAVALSSAIWAPPVIRMIQFRFFSSFTVESDSTRDIQSTELIQGILQKPFWGHGMGSFIPDLIRSEALPFSYEKEYLSFVFQLGIVGFFIIIAGIIIVYAKQMVIYLKNVPCVIKIFSITGFMWFLIRPAFNPSFLGLQGGFPVIGIWLFMAYYANRTKQL